MKQRMVKNGELARISSIKLGFNSKSLEIEINNINQNNMLLMS